jgi:hypothetical protein
VVVGGGAEARVVVGAGAAAFVSVVEVSAAVVSVVEVSVVAASVDVDSAAACSDIEEMGAVSSADSSAPAKGAVTRASTATDPANTPIRRLVEASFQRNPVILENAFLELFTESCGRSDIYQRVNPACMRVISSPHIGRAAKGILRHAVP